MSTEGGLGSGAIWVKALIGFSGYVQHFAEINGKVLHLYVSEGGKLKSSSDLTEAWADEGPHGQDVFPFTVEGPYTHGKLYFGSRTLKDREEWVTNIKRAAADNVHWEGPLKKRGGWNKAFKSRYFRLCGQDLHYFENKCSKRIDTIPLAAASVTSGPGSSFTVIGAHTKRTYMFEAPSAEQRDKWLEKIQSAAASVSDGKLHDQVGRKVSCNIGLHMKLRGFLPKYPVVLIPGFMSTSLALEESVTLPEWKGERVWLNLAFMAKGMAGGLGGLRSESNVWLKHMIMSMSNGTSDPEGVRVRPLSGLQAVECLEPGLITGQLSYVLAPVIQALKDLGYAEGENLEACPYDWRIPPMHMGIRDDYFNVIKDTVEKLHRRIGMPVILIGHSMGGKVIQYFTHWAHSNCKFEEPSDQIKSFASPGRKWLKKYIHSAMTIGTPFLGAPKAIRTIITGDKMGLDTFLYDVESIQFARTVSCGPFLLPIELGSPFTYIKTLSKEKASYLLINIESMEFVVDEFHSIPIADCSMKAQVRVNSHHFVTMKRSVTFPREEDTSPSRRAMSFLGTFGRPRSKVVSTEPRFGNCIFNDHYQADIPLDGARTRIHASAIFQVESEHRRFYARDAGLCEMIDCVNVPHSSTIEMVDASNRVAALLRVTLCILSPTDLQIHERTQRKGWGAERAGDSLDRIWGKNMVVSALASPVKHSVGGAFKFACQPGWDPASVGEAICASGAMHMYNWWRDYVMLDPHHGSSVPPVAPARKIITVQKNCKDWISEVKSLSLPPCNSNDDLEESGDYDTALLPSASLGAEDLEESFEEVDSSQGVPDTPIPDSSCRSPTYNYPFPHSCAALEPMPIDNLVVVYGRNVRTERFYFYTRAKTGGTRHDPYNFSLLKLSDDPPENLRPDISFSMGVGYEEPHKTFCYDIETDSFKQVSGDGTVPYASLKYPISWNGKGIDVQIREIEGAEHREILCNVTLHETILKHISSPPYRIMKLYILSAEKLKAADASGGTDAFVEVEWYGMKFCTPTVSSSLNPVWTTNNFFELGIPCPTSPEAVRQEIAKKLPRLTAWDSDFGTKSEFLGYAHLNWDSVMQSVGPTQEVIPLIPQPKRSDRCVGGFLTVNYHILNPNRQSQDSDSEDEDGEHSA